MSELEIKDRILRVLTRQQLSSARFADIIKVQRSSISHILSGRNNPSLDFLQKVLINFPKLNAEWLILGKGEMFTETNQSQLNFDVSKSKQETIIPPIYSENPPQNIIIREVAAKESSPRAIKKIVIFYDDNSFEELKPKKEKNDA